MKKILIASLVILCAAVAFAGGYRLGLARGQDQGYDAGFRKGRGQAKKADRPVVMPLLLASEVSADALLAAAGWTAEDLGGVHVEAWARLLNLAPGPRPDQREQGLTLATVLAGEPTAGDLAQAAYGRDLLAAGRTEDEARLKLYRQVRQQFDPAGALVLGPDTAPVEIVWWVDFQCPYCEQTWPLVQGLHEQYPDQVRIVVMNLPLRMHKEADEAALAAWAAGQQGRFEQLAEVLFEKRKKLKKHVPKGGGVALEKLAGSADLDLERYRTDYEAARPMLEAHQQQAREAGVRSVPSFYVNGLLVKLPRSLDAWTSYVDRILAGEDPALDA